MTAHETLIAAKALIPDEAHWWRGESDPGHRDQYVARDGNCYCVLTALDEIAPTYRVLRDCLSVLDKIIGDDDQIVDWNDAPERTLAEVHAAFDRAIEATKP